MAATLLRHSEQVRMAGGGTSFFLSFILISFFDWCVFCIFAPTELKIKKRSDMEKLKLIWTILFVVAFSTVAHAGDSMFSASSATCAPGQEAVIGISLDNANEVNGLQFDILLPEGIQLVMDGQGSPLITPTDRTEGFSVICKKLESNRYRLMSLSFQGAKVNGNAGLVLSMSVKCDAAMEKGDHKILFEEVHVSYANTELNKTDSNLPTFETTVTVK